MTKSGEELDVLPMDFGDDNAADEGANDGVHQLLAGHDETGQKSESRGGPLSRPDIPYLTIIMAKANAH